MRARVAVLGVVISGCWDWSALENGARDVVDVRSSDGALRDALDAPNDTVADLANGDVDPGSIAPPQLIAPTSGVVIGAPSPTLRWSLPAGTDGAHVFVCSDRACMHVERDLPSLGASVMVVPPLAPGVHFWRAVGRRSGTDGSTTTPTWEFAIERRSAPMATAVGFMVDLNGDAFADLVVGASQAGGGVGRAYAYLGATAGLATTPSATWIGAAPNGGFGSAAATAGDVNGDGFADVIVGAPGTTGATGAASVFAGGATLASAPATVLTGTDGLRTTFGSSVACAGDVNGDGFTDVIVGVPFADGGNGRAYVYFGASGGLPTTPSVMLLGPGGGSALFGTAVASAGDANGDGYADVIVGAPSASGASGAAYLYLGGASGPSTATAMIIAPPGGANGRFGAALAFAGDLNGDGLGDVVIGAPGAGASAGRAYTYVGIAAGLAPSTVLAAPDGAAGEFGASVSGALDVNADGFADVVIGARNVGAAYVFVGGAGGLGSSASARLAGLGSMADSFGAAVVGAADLDGDGFDDVAIGAPGGGGNIGETFVFVGNGTGVTMSPASVLFGLDGANGFFGSALASWRRSDTTCRIAPIFALHCARSATSSSRRTSVATCARRA